MKPCSAPYNSIEEELLDLIMHYRAITPSQMKEALPISRVMIHRYLKRFVKYKQVEKWGRTPWVAYVPNPNQPTPFEQNQIKAQPAPPRPFSIPD